MLLGLYLLDYLYAKMAFSSNAVSRRFLGSTYSKLRLKCVKNNVFLTF